MKITIPNFDDLSVIKTGDMPGDKVEIAQKHIDNSIKIANEIIGMIDGKTVISVYGGSGVGKSETASVLGHILKANGINTYVLSGDNYPRRYPMINDEERIRVFRDAALKGIVSSGEYTNDARAVIFNSMDDEGDLNEDNIKECPFLKTYITEGKRALDFYLGTYSEIDFDQINNIIGSFKKGQESILLKRMGRTKEEIWYDAVDFSDVDVIIVEWTHGNNENLVGIDIPILLNSTPEETLAHRASRNRDGKVDSPFVKIVLTLEQAKLHKQAVSSKVIVTKDGDLIDYKTYSKLMEGLNV